MKKFFETNYTFEELYSKLAECKNIDIAYELYSPYSIREIADSCGDFKRYTIFVEDGIYVIDFKVGGEIIQVCAFSYIDWTDQEKLNFYDELYNLDAEDTLYYIKRRWHLWVQ